MLYNSEDESGEFILELFSSIPLFGSIANAVFIVCGALAGLLLRKKIPAKIMELPVQGMALFVVTLGVGMAIKTQQPLVVIASIALGSLIGELMDLEGALEAASMKLENRIGDSAKGFSTGFITTSLIYCTGSMAVQ